MKRICVYNSKGGVGKTTLNVLLADFLAYRERKRVLVFDFDAPSFHLDRMRRDDLEVLGNPSSALARVRESLCPDVEPYEIRTVKPMEDGEFDLESVYVEMTQLDESLYDYVIYDFRGSFGPREPIAMLAVNGLIDYMLIPIDRDAASRRDALVIADAMKNAGIEYGVMWNKLMRRDENEGVARLLNNEAVFHEKGLRVLDIRLRFAASLSGDSSENLFIRNTVCFPEQYIRLRSNTIVPLLDYIKSYVDNIEK